MLDRGQFPAGTIFTIGHSTRAIDDFTGMLKNFGIQTLVDIRTVPRSRYNPQFGQNVLPGSLGNAGIAYIYMKDLGGLRKALADSINTGWRSGGFRGYADYMQTTAFAAALGRLIALGRSSRTVIMCAEAVPWRCHRSLVSDALIVNDMPVQHIMSATQSSPHALTGFAKVEGTAITYPPGDDGQGRLF